VTAKACGFVAASPPGHRQRYARTTTSGRLKSLPPVKIRISVGEQGLTEQGHESEPCETKPISQLRVGDRLTAGRPPCRFASAGRLYKQTQFPPGLGGRGPRGTARNKPNSGRAPGNGRGLPGPRAPAGERLCETKPNLGGLGHMGKGNHRKSSGFAGRRSVLNKAGRRLSAIGSQLGDRSCETNPICRPGSIPGNSLSRWHGPRWHGLPAHGSSAGYRGHGIGLVWQTSIGAPNLTRDCSRRVDGIEPGQFSGAGANEKSFSEKRLWESRAACRPGRTKPILGGWDGARGTGAGGCCTNKANWPGLILQNEPNFPAVPGGPPSASTHRPRPAKPFVRNKANFEGRFRPGGSRIHPSGTDLIPCPA
jgi:hypothetical protein